MSLKWFGIIAIIAGCGSFGFRMAAAHRREEKRLRQLLSVLELMQSELEYRLTPLPELCALSAAATDGAVNRVFACLQRELENQVSPDAFCCMRTALANIPLSDPLRGLMLELGKTLGRYDLPGQLRGIDGVRHQTQCQLDRLTKDREFRLRSYQTLGLCAGAALAILLL